MNMNVLMTIPKEEIPRAAEALTMEDIQQLVDLLDEKADAPRYQALLLLTARSERTPDVLPHWPRFCGKLTDGNSYQRSIGILLLAANARWAETRAIDECLPGCLRLITDEKPITARQAIQALGRIAKDSPHTAKRIADALMGLDILSVRETMRKSILLDICHALLPLNGTPDLKDSLGAFLSTALSGDILDKASKKEILKELAQ